MFEHHDDDLTLLGPSARAGGGLPGKGGSTARLGPSAAAIARAMLVQLKQAAAAPDLDAGLAAAAAGPRAGGQALPGELRGRFEQSLGVDLGAVRVHTDDHARDAAAALGARAFAVGDDLFFGAGEYQPHSDDGARLLAHEVAHTVQQHGAAIPQAKLAVSTPGDAFETEADRAADAMVAGQPAAVSRLGGAQVQRQVPPTQVGAGTFEAVRACREAERADARGRARTSIPPTTVSRNLPLEPLARALAASFATRHNDPRHAVPGEAAILTALRGYVRDDTDLSAPIDVPVRAPTGWNDGRDDSTYYVILRFEPAGPAELQYSNNGGSLASEASTSSRAGTEGTGVSVSAPPVGLASGSSSSTGYAQSQSEASSQGVGRERWRMNLTANASWQRRDDWGAAQATGWPYVAFGRVGHVEFMQEGPVSPCSALAGSPAIPTTIAAPAAVSAPAPMMPALNNTATTSDTTTQTTTTATNTNTNYNHAMPTPAATGGGGSAAPAAPTRPATAPRPQPQPPVSVTARPVGGGPLNPAAPQLPSGAVPQLPSGPGPVPQLPSGAVPQLPSGPGPVPQLPSGPLPADHH